MKRIITLLFLLNVSLFAHPNDVIYVFGYGELMQQALNNIAFFLENSSGLTKSALAIGVMLVGYKSIINPKASPFFTIGKTMAIFIVISGLFFYSDKGNTRYTFTIKDTSNNQTFRADGVPLGLGKMLSLVGMFEKGMVVGLETAFGSYQDEVNSFAKSGFLFPLKAKLAVNDIRLTDKNNIISNFNTYYSDCLINSGAVNEAGFIEAIMRGANEINKVCNTSQSRQGFLTKYKEDVLGNTGLITGSTTQIVTCKQLCDNIKQDINAMVNDPNTVRKGLNDTLAKHFMTSGFDNNKDLQKLNKFIQNWGEAIDDSSKAYKNAVMLNLLDEAHMNKAALLGMNAKGSAFGLATAQTHAKQSFIMSGFMAGEFLPLIKAIVHIIIAIMSVFLIMLSIMFMQPMFVKTFVTLNLWIVFWSPLIAIINFIMIYNIEKVVNYVKSQGYDPFSVLGSNMLDGKILDYLAYEGTLAWLVPILAFAIASGSAQGFVAFASSLSQQFASASMMGARQVTGMATQGSQSIRDGNSTYTKDGSGITRLTTSIAGGQKVDYAIKYGNTDKAQEVEARGTNFSYKTDAEAMMMTGRFDNLALNNAISSGTNSGHTQQSGDNQNITKGGGVSETGSKVVTDTFKDGENNRQGMSNDKTFKENWNNEEATKIVKNTFAKHGITITDEKAQTLTNSISANAGITASATTKYKDLGQAVGASVGAEMKSSFQTSEKTSIANAVAKDLTSGLERAFGSTHGKAVGEGEQIVDAHDFTQGRDHSTSATTNKNYNDSTNYQNGQTSSQTDNYGTSQSENTSLSHNSVAATMNAKMIASGMSGMSFEERLNYLSTQMAEMGNMSALSKDVGAMNDKLDAGIQGVSDNTYKVDTTPIAKKTEERKREVGNEHNRIRNEDVNNTTKLDNLKPSKYLYSYEKGIYTIDKDGNEHIIKSKEELVNGKATLVRGHVDENKHPTGPGLIRINGEDFIVNGSKADIEKLRNEDVRKLY